MVEIEYFVTLEAVYDFQRSQDIAPCIFGAFVDEVALEFRHAAAGVVAETPFLADDPALVVEGLLLAGDVAGPVVQDGQHGIHEGFPHQRHLGKVVDRFGPGRVCVHVVAETHAFLCQEIENALFRIVACSVECHVLEEVGQAVLIVLFLEGAHIVRNVEFGASLGLPVVAKIIAQTVAEPAGAEVRIVRDCLCGNCLGGE